MSAIRKINLQNKRMIAKLNTFATAFYRMPHTFTSSPLPVTTYARLAELKADPLFNGIPAEHNYTDFSAATAGAPQSNLQPGSTVIHNKKDFQVVKHFLKETFKAGIPEGSHPDWYLDTLCVMAPEVGFTGWHNNWQKPKHSLRFIHNNGSGYTLFRVGDNQMKFIDAPGWTCIYNYSLADKSIWMCDRNKGETPRLVIDFSIKPRYVNKVEQVIEFIESTAS